MLSRRHLPTLETMPNSLELQRLAWSALEVAPTLVQEAQCTLPHRSIESMACEILSTSLPKDYSFCFV